MLLTNNIEHNAGTCTISSSGCCAGVGATVTGVDTCSGNYTCYSSSCRSETTATTGRCPHKLIIPTPTSSCCCAGDNMWTRGCPVISGVLWSEARRISAVNSYADSERTWREENKLCPFLRALVRLLPVLHGLRQMYTYMYYSGCLSLFRHLTFSLKLARMTQAHSNNWGR